MCINSTRHVTNQQNHLSPPPPPLCKLSPKPPLLLSPFTPTMNWLSKLGLLFGARTTTEPSPSPLAQSPDDDLPAPGNQFAQFGAGCFWGVELGFQRVIGVTKTEVGYSQGFVDNPTYNDVCSGTTNHSEVVRVQYDPKDCGYESLLDVFWARHDPTTLNRQVSLFNLVNHDCEVLFVELFYCLLCICFCSSRFFT